jgi:6-pyruvoyltetrahydropterin/6-carboxytetrahydropterin synthase
MKVKISKEFHWQMSHRLPFHKGLCSNIHGHSYKLRVTVVGETDSNGMVIDFYDLIAIVQPLIDQLEHSVVVDKDDTKFISFLKENDFRYVEVPTTTTSENLSFWIANQIAEKIKVHSNIDKLIVRFYETTDSFAEYEIDIKANGN